jgi:hypothetical protein
MYSITLEATNGDDSKESVNATLVFRPSFVSSCQNAGAITYMSAFV